MPEAVESVKNPVKDNGASVSLKLPLWVVDNLKKQGLAGLLLLGLGFFLWYGTPRVLGVFMEEIHAQRADHQKSIDRLERAIEKLTDALNRATIRPKEDGGEA